MLNKLLLTNMWNTNLRSFIVGLGIVIGTAGLEVLDTQLTDGHFNFSLVAGAAIAAGVKFLHSSASRAALLSLWNKDQ